MGRHDRSDELRVASPRPSGARRWLSGRALLLHLALLVWFPGCLVAGWWQVRVALSGNGLAYLYSVEWPVFALFGAVAWWHLLHDDPETTGERGLRRLRSTASDPGTSGAGLARRPEEEDEALAAYNDFLEGLAQRNEPKTWRSS